MNKKLAIIALVAGAAGVAYYLHKRRSCACHGGASAPVGGADTVKVSDTAPASSPATAADCSDCGLTPTRPESRPMLPPRGPMLPELAQPAAPAPAWNVQADLIRPAPRTTIAPSAPAISVRTFEPAITVHAALSTMKTTRLA